MLEGVQALPDDRREALIMRFALGMDNREIAKALGRSEGATKVLIHRAIKQLDERMERRRVEMSEVERLLHYALSPVEPPGTLTARLEQRLSHLTDAAVDELAEFDPSAIRDPRRWARLVAAGVVAGGAGGALILVRARQKHRRNGPGACVRCRRACARSAPTCAPGSSADPARGFVRRNGRGHPPTSPTRS